MDHSGTTRDKIRDKRNSAGPDRNKDAVYFIGIARDHIQGKCRETFTQVLQPIVQLVMAPDCCNSGKIPNEDSLGFDFDRNLIKLHAFQNDGAPIPPNPRALKIQPLNYTPPKAVANSQALGNGFVGFFVEDHDLPLVNVPILIRTGAYVDPAGKEGLASATASAVANRSSVMTGASTTVPGLAAAGHCRTNGTRMPPS